MKLKLLIYSENNMGTWSPTISGNDYFLDIEAKIVEICGLDFFEYLLDNSILTPELFNTHFDEIVKLSFHRNEHQGPLALGFLIMKLGTKIPKEVRIDILTEVEVELIDWIYDDPEYGRLRQPYLKEFKEKLWNYREGEKIHLREISLIGLSFIRELLEPALADLIKYNASERMRKFIQILIEKLDTPLVEICKILNINSGKEYYEFFKRMGDFGREDCTNGENGAEITLIADLFISRVVDDLKIEDAWIGKSSFGTLDRLELLEHDDGFYKVYRAELHGRKFIGQCVIPLQQRSAQHIAKFKIAP